MPPRLVRAERPAFNEALADTTWNVCLNAANNPQLNNYLMDMLTVNRTRWLCHATRARWELGRSGFQANFWIEFFDMSAHSLCCGMPFLLT